MNRRDFIGAVGLGPVLRSAAMQTEESSIAAAIRSGGQVSGLDVVDVHAHIGDNPADAIWPQDAESLVADMDRCGVATAIFSDLGAIHALSAPEYAV